MLADAAFPLVRFLLYADLMLLAGLAAATLFVWPPVQSWRTVFVSLVGGGMVAAVAHMAVSIGTMMGQAAWEVEPEVTRLIITDTASGWAFVIRFAALAFALPLAYWPSPSRVRLATLAVLTAVSLGSLAWNGHAAATEGFSGTLHRLADAAHLVAAAWWLAALAAFVVAVLSVRASMLDDQLADALARFSGLGTALLLVIVATGVVNLAFVVGIDRLAALLTQTYGQLLILKLALFVGMLALAARNRWALTPALARADLKSKAYYVHRLQRSLGLELGLGIAVLAVVAWLGVLPPLPD